MLSLEKVKSELTKYNYTYENNILCGHTKSKIKWVLPTGVVKVLAFDKDKQFIFESILFSAMTLYHNGGASKNKIAETHKRFVQDIEMKKEEKLSRTQELNTAKVQALRELGYSEINETNAKEVLEKIAEIQSRKV